MTERTLGEGRRKRNEAGREMRDMGGYLVEGGERSGTIEGEKEKERQRIVNCDSNRPVCYLSVADAFSIDYYLLLVTCCYFHSYYYCYCYYYPYFYCYCYSHSLELPLHLSYLDGAVAKKGWANMYRQWEDPVCTPALFSRGCRTYGQILRTFRRISSEVRAVLLLLLLLLLLLAVAVAVVSAAFS